MATYMDGMRPYIEYIGTYMDYMETFMRIQIHHGTQVNNIPLNILFIT